MKQTNKNFLMQFISPIVTALVVAGVFGIVHYLWLAKECELSIKNIQRNMDLRFSNMQENRGLVSADVTNGMNRLSCQVDRLSRQVENSACSINNIKLFIASAHPEKSILPLSSARKLQRLGPQEIATLSESVGRYSSAESFAQTASKDDPRIHSLMADHDIKQNDLQNYWNMTSGRPQKDPYRRHKQ